MISHSVERFPIAGWSSARIVLMLRSQLVVRVQALDTKERLVVFVERSDLERAVRTAIDSTWALRIHKEWMGFSSSISDAVVAVAIIPQLDFAPTG